MADAKSVFSGVLTKDRTDVIVAIGVVVVVMMLIIPLPTVLLDFFMALNLVLSLLILLIVLYTKRAIDFSVFPTMLLVSTVFGLALNVSSTRLILTQGSKFDGKMVKAFSTFVVGSEGTNGLAIGFVIFIILIAVQAIVITKGASRVAEVAARFTLDAMPTKMMEIESERSSGAITEEEAKIKKNEVQRQSDFYGAMDGASKFVSGNVKVGIFITAVNLVVGLILGMVMRGESFSDALQTYAALTIGDGLLSQLPSLLISVATGIIVTRAVSDNTFGEDIRRQFLKDARIYFVCAAVLTILALLPGFPHLVLLILAALLVFVGMRLSRSQTASFKEEMEKKEARAAKNAEGAPGKTAAIAPLDPLSLELGYNLVPLVDKGAELIERIGLIRSETALDLGITIPAIRIIDNLRIDPGEYRFKIKGAEVARGQIRMGAYLCINPGGAVGDIPGEKTVDPTFGLPALWVSESNRERAEQGGYTVVDPPSVIATHLTDVIKRHAAEILGRQEVHAMLETLRRDYSAVVDEVLNASNQNHYTVGEIQKVLQGLLREQVSIRNMVVILETLANYAAYTKDTAFLIEKVRQALGRQICLQYADEDHVLHALTIDPAFEQKIIDSRADTSDGPIAALDPASQRSWIRAVTNAFTAAQEKGFFPVILCSEAARALVKSSTDRELPSLVALSVPELSPEIRVETIGAITVD